MSRRERTEKCLDNIFCMTQWLTPEAGWSRCRWGWPGCAEILAWPLSAAGLRGPWSWARASADVTREGGGGPPGGGGRPWQARGHHRGGAGVEYLHAAWTPGIWSDLYLQHLMTWYKQIPWHQSSFASWSVGRAHGDAVSGVLHSPQTRVKFQTVSLPVRRLGPDRHRGLVCAWGHCHRLPDHPRWVQDGFVDEVSGRWVITLRSGGAWSLCWGIGSLRSGLSRWWQWWNKNNSLTTFFDYTLTAIQASVAQIWSSSLEI